MNLYGLCLIDDDRYMWCVLTTIPSSFSWMWHRRMWIITHRICTCIINTKSGMLILSKICLPFWSPSDRVIWFLILVHWSTPSLCWSVLKFLIMCFIDWCLSFHCLSFFAMTLPVCLQWLMKFNINLVFSASPKKTISYHQTMRGSNRMSGNMVACSPQL